MNSFFINFLLLIIGITRHFQKVDILLNKPVLPFKAIKLKLVEVYEILVERSNNLCPWRNKKKVCGKEKNIYQMRNFPDIIQIFDYEVVCFTYKKNEQS